VAVSFESFAGFNAADITLRRAPEILQLKFVTKVINALEDLTCFFCSYEWLVIHFRDTRAHQAEIPKGLADWLIPAQPV
jgi:hypothetical protein